MPAGAWNTRNPAVKRIVQELREMEKEDDPDLLAEAIEENIFEWHFVIRGAWDSEFEGGIYHGRILMPAEYPFKPPAFVMLTPSGRFETGAKICLSISSHHPESWQPSWSVRSALVALIAFMQTPGNGALGSLDHPEAARRQMAAESRGRPPAYGTPDRQALINAMHQRMLDLEETSRARCRQERAADGADAAGAAAAAAPEAAAPPAAEAADAAEPAAEAAAALPWAAPPAEPPAAAAESSAAAAPAPAPAASPAAAPEAQLRQRPAAAAAAAPASPAAAPPPLPLSPAQPLAAPAEPAAVLAHPQAHHGHQSWEDRGLTYLAVILVLCIAALLVRKVLVAFASPDDLYTFNHVERVEL